MLPAQAGVVPEGPGGPGTVRRAPRAGGGGPGERGGERTEGPCSPRRRGWSLGEVLRAVVPPVLPAQAGVVPTRRTGRRRRTRAPRAGGGGPSANPSWPSSLLCSPRRRGWSPGEGQPVPETVVLPAQAGVVPPAGRRFHSPGCAPRAGGGGPVPSSVTIRHGTCSPRRRGWSLVGGHRSPPPIVLPAQAGVVPRAGHTSSCPPGAPRAGGGGPRSTAPSAGARRCSPRRRGWSRGDEVPAREGEVLPAQAGVVPPREQPRQLLGEVLPAQAGVVPSPRPRGRRRVGAPRAGGGGPVAPAYAGIEVGAPRAGGGGPYADAVHAASCKCSPRRRGWSQGPPLARRVDPVLPAQAGVVPSRYVAGRRRPVLPAQAGVVPPLSTPSRRRGSAPRAGGGGPSITAPITCRMRCSPRRRGWSRLDVEHGLVGVVLPAQVGVVPSPGCSCSRTRPVLPAQAGVVPRSRCLPAARSGAPRAGGGGPATVPVGTGYVGCSPRRRGWSHRGRGGGEGEPVLPAQAGVVPGPDPVGPVARRAPRAGGGGPSSGEPSSSISLCSPRRRGWSQVADLLRHPDDVLPAQAGVRHEPEDHDAELTLVPPRSGAQRGRRRRVRRDRGLPTGPGRASGSAGG